MYLIKHPIKVAIWLHNTYLSYPIEFELNGLLQLTGLMFESCLLTHLLQKLSPLLVPLFSQCCTV